VDDGLGTQVDDGDAPANGRAAPQLGPRTPPSEVVTDLAPTYPVVLEELLPTAWHRTDRYANDRIEADHGRLKARLRPMRGLRQEHSARVVIAGHAFVQNVRRGQYELAVEEPVRRRLAVAFDELALAI
jgi:transposase-like protein